MCHRVIFSVLYRASKMKHQNEAEAIALFIDHGHRRDLEIGTACQYCTREFCSAKRRNFRTIRIGVWQIVRPYCFAREPNAEC